MRGDAVPVTDFFNQIRGGLQNLGGTMAEQVETSKLSIMQILLVLGIFALGILLGYMAFKVIEKNGGPEVLLPLLAIGGILALLVVLAIVSVFFQTIGLSNKEQALALPEGSVRAVIALSLIVLFAILSIYLYATLGKVSLDNVTEAQRTQLLQAGTQIISTTEANCLPGTSPAAGGAPVKCYAIVYRAPNTVGEDFAKQLLVMLGTLVTAVASFYFGGQIANSAQSAGAKAATGGAGPSIPTPTLRSLNPNKLPAGQAVDPFTIVGDDLNPVTQVRLVQGTSQIVGTNIKSNDHEVTCKLVIDAGAPKGKYNVVVSNKDGKVRAELADAFEVT
jgi:hypothetical protein